MQESAINTLQHSSSNTCTPTCSLCSLFLSTKYTDKSHEVRDKLGYYQFVSESLAKNWHQNMFFLFLFKDKLSLFVFLSTSFMFTLFMYNTHIINYQKQSRIRDQSKYISNKKNSLTKLKATKFSQKGYTKTMVLLFS